MIVEEPVVDETIVKEPMDVDTQEESAEVYDDPAVLYEDESQIDENSHHYFLNNFGKPCGRLSQFYRIFAKNLL